MKDESQVGETWLSNVAEASSYDAGSHILDEGFTEF